MTPSDKPTEPGGVVERLAAAKVGSRELDRDIAKAIDRAEWAKCANWASMPCGAPPETIDRDALRWLPAYTTSLDAALALAERLGLRPYSADAGIPGRWSWMVQDPSKLGDLEAEPYKVGTSSTPALALCLAILRAHPSDGESK